MKINKSDKDKYKDRVQAYIDGRGRLVQKWLKPPKVDEEFLNTSSGVVVTDDICRELYPFAPGTPDEKKFRLLIALRFTSMLGGLDEDSEEVKTITEWLRQLALFSEPIRKKCGIRNWRPFWDISEYKIEDIEYEE